MGVRGVYQGPPGHRSDKGVLGNHPDLVPAHQETPTAYHKRGGIKHLHQKGEPLQEETHRYKKDPNPTAAVGDTRQATFRGVDSIDSERTPHGTSRQTVRDTGTIPEGLS